jgi:hypothetical protein
MFVMAATICLLGAVWHPAIFTSTMASWVQGFGTLGAIWAAIHAGGEQGRSDRQIRKQQAVDRLAAITDAFQFGILIADKTSVAITDRSVADWNVGREEYFAREPLEGMNKLLAMEITDWPSHILYQRAVRLRTALKVLLELNPGDPPLQPGFLAHADMFNARYVEATAEYSRSLDGAKLPD